MILGRGLQPDCPAALLEQLERGGIGDDATAVAITARRSPREARQHLAREPAVVRLAVELEDGAQREARVLSTRASSSTNATPSRAASAGPMVLLPAPRSPPGRSRAARCARAGPRRAALRRTSPAPALRPAGAQPRCSPGRPPVRRGTARHPLRWRAPAGKGPLLPETADGGADGGEETWCSRLMLLQYSASVSITTSNIVLAFAQPLR